MHDIYMIIPGSPCSNAVQSKYELDRRRGRGHPPHPPHPLKMGVGGFLGRGEGLPTGGAGVPLEVEGALLKPYLAHGGEGRHVRWFGGQYLEVNGDHVSSER